MSTLTQINKKAKALRKITPSMSWNDAQRKAAAQLKKPASKRTTKKATVSPRKVKAAPASLSVGVSSAKVAAGKVVAQMATVAAKLYVATTAAEKRELRSKLAKLKKAAAIHKRSISQLSKIK